MFVYLIIQLVTAWASGSYELITFVKDSTKLVPVSTGICHRISLDRHFLRFDSTVLGETVINKKDGFEDFPDSTWEGFHLKSVKSWTVKTVAKDPSSTIQFDFLPSLAYATVKPIIRAVAVANVQHAQLGMGGRDSIEIELFNKLRDGYMTHSGSESCCNTIIQVAPDCIWVYVNSQTKNGNLILKLATNRDRSLSESEKGKIEQALVGNLPKASKPQWLGIDPHPSTPMERVFDIFRIVNRINRTSSHLWMNSYLYGVFNPWSNEAIQKQKINKALCDSAAKQPPIRFVEPKYPTAELNKGEPSSVLVEIVVDSLGKLKDAVIVESGGKAFDVAVKEAIQATQFKIDCVEGDPSPYRFRKRFMFRTQGP